MHCSTASGEEVGGAQMQSRRINPKTQFSVPFSIYCHSPGPPPHWQLHHIPLNATSRFQVEFEVSIGAGNSSGGIQADDIDLFECMFGYIESANHVFHSLLQSRWQRDILLLG